MPGMTYTLMHSNDTGSTTFTILALIATITLIGFTIYTFIKMWKEHKDDEKHS